MSTVALHPRLHGGLALSWRYLQAASGPVVTAVAHFVLSLLLLHALAPEAFGRLSFLLVASQLGCGIWSALFCAPLAVLLARSGREEDADADTVRRCILTVNLAGAAVSLPLFLLLALGIGTSLLAALLFAAYAACYLLRCLARAFAYAAGQPLRVMTSDFAYSAVLLAGLFVMWRAPAYATPAASCALLLGGAVAGLLPFGREYVAAQCTLAAAKDFRAYSGIWRRHSQWSLLGVLTTEATTNAHAYLLALFIGPVAFAPVAASALLIRPIGVVVNALGEFERPRIASLIGKGDMGAAFRSLRILRIVLALTWIGSAVAASILLTLAPRMVFPAGYDLNFLIVGTALWMAVALVRQWRTADSVLLQADGDFRALAQASLASSVVSVAAVAVLLWTAGPLWSIAGLLAGEIVCACWTRRQTRRYRH